MHIDLGTISGTGPHVKLDKGVNTVAFEVLSGFGYVSSQLKLAHDQNTGSDYSKIATVVEDAAGNVVDRDAYVLHGGDIVGQKQFPTTPGKYLATLNCSAAIACAILIYHQNPKPSLAPPPKKRR